MKRAITIILVNILCINVTFSQEQRITGGYDLDIKDAPYQVLLMDNNQYICGGSIIASDYILTAKHCCINTNTHNLKVIAGVTCKNEIGDNNIYSVSEIILHPTLDIALLRLSKDIIFDNSKQSINFIKSLNTEFYKTGNNVKVSGWGWLTPNGYNPANCLQGVDVDIISNNEANQMFSDEDFKVQDYEVATIGVGRIRKGSCHGDSGGPLVIWSENDKKYILLGVVSWGKARCMGDNSNSPSVFVRVDKAVPWIVEKLYPVFGASTICNQDTEEYSIENLPERATVHWEISAGSSVEIVSGQNTPNIVLKANLNEFSNSFLRRKYNYFNPKLIAKITIDSETVSIPKQININPIPTFRVTIDGAPQEDMDLFTGLLYDFAADETDADGYPYSNYEWLVKAPAPPYGQNPQEDFAAQGSSFRYMPLIPGDYQITLTATGRCDRVTRNYTKRFKGVYIPKHPVDIYPNPTNGSNYVTIHVPTYKMNELNLNGRFNGHNFIGGVQDHFTNTQAVTNVIVDPTGQRYRIKVFNNSRLVKVVNTIQRRYQLSLQGIPTGFYYVHIIIGNQVIRKQLIIK